MERLESKFLTFDLRKLALEKLKKYSDNSDYIHYRDARCVLGRQFHIPRRMARSLLIQMSKDGLIRFDVKGRVFISGV